MPITGLIPIIGPQSPSAGSGLIVLTSQSRESAAANCAALGEQLWRPEWNTASIQPSLDYLTYENKYHAGQQYWISPNSADYRAIDRHGYIKIVSPHLHLPALCTQSAPFSNSTYQDTSRQWQVTVHSNNEYLTGYVIWIGILWACSYIRRFRDRRTFQFLGIRYAPKPERFAHSIAYTGTNNQASATSYGSECVQSGNVGAEDCLFLNIWTPFLPAHPRAPFRHLKPVMFWIHGGAFTSGTGNDPTVNGANIASRGDVVLVTINYRLGSEGFLALNDGVTRGNYGFADQLNALHWVRTNIQDFGGDPDRITVFGQSAGAASVRAMLASPKAKGMFKGAILQSNLGGGGYGTTYSQYLTIEQEVMRVGNSILANTNCSTSRSQVDCLRAIPANTLANLAPVARYLVIDGTYLISDGLAFNNTEALSDVHLLSGFMRDDGAAMITIIDTDNLTISLNDNGFPASLVESSGLFPVPVSQNGTLDVFNVSSRVATDTIFRCIDQASMYAAMKFKTFAPNVYLYEFNRSYQTPGWDPNAPLCDAPITASHPYGDPNQEYFKCHSGDLYFVFGNILSMGYHLRDENDLLFSQFVLDSWASFARTWNPNPDPAFLIARKYLNTLTEVEARGGWPPVSRDKLMLRELQWPSRNIPFRDVKQCAALGWPLDYFI